VAVSARTIEPRVSRWCLWWLALLGGAPVLGTSRPKRHRAFDDRI